MKIILLALVAIGMLIGTTQAQSVFVSTIKACSGAEINLQIIKNNLNDADIVSVQWDLNSSGFYNDASGDTASFYSAQDTLNVRVEVYTIADTLYASKEVVPTPLPSINFHVDNLCQGKTATYMFDYSSDTINTFTTFKWDFDNDGDDDDSSGDTVRFNNGTAGMYVTKLEAVTDQGCSAITTKTTKVYGQPVSAFSVADVCLGNASSFVNTSTTTADTISMYLWSFGDGVQSADLTPTHLYANTGTFDVSLITASGIDCRDTTTKQISVYAIPTVTIDVDGDTLIYSNESVTLSATTTAITYKWSTNQSTESIVVNQSVNYVLTVTDANGCKETTSQTVQVKVVNGLSIKSKILTPNADGVNDKLEVEDLESYDKLTISIYNIQGEEIYSSLDYKNEWDATHNGLQVDGGTYYFILTDGTEELKGSVNVLR